MKDKQPKQAFNYLQIVLVAIVAELILITIQFAYLNIYSRSDEGTEFSFTSAYMKSRGFYIFQIIGFFVYITVVYLILPRIQTNVLTKLAVLVLAGGIVELSFYLVMNAEYEGAYLYSILDKIVAAAFGLILYRYTTGSSS